MKLEGILKSVLLQEKGLTFVSKITLIVAVLPTAMPAVKEELTR
jgi:flagellar biosynthesis protein FliQ